MEFKRNRTYKEQCVNLFKKREEKVKISTYITRLLQPYHDS